MISSKKAEVDLKTLFFIVIGVFSMMILFAMFLSYSNFSNSEGSNNECDDDCLYQRAHLENFNSEELCANIENLNLKSKCLREVGIRSIITAAVEFDNIDFCNRLPNELNLINYCRDNYYLAKFYETQNYDYCNNITDGKLSTDCYEYIFN